ncbi:hypothetical protein IAS59_001972 [Cryptococcus gattii]
MAILTTPAQALFIASLSNFWILESSVRMRVSGNLSIRTAAFLFFLRTREMLLSSVIAINKTMSLWQSLEGWESPLANEECKGECKLG